MTISEPFVILLALLLWVAVYTVVQFLFRLIFFATKHPNLYSNLVSLFWPITLPLGFVFLLGWGAFSAVRHRKW